jgi:hypothetical protein
MLFLQFYTVYNIAYVLCSNWKVADFFAKLPKTAAESNRIVNRNFNALAHSSATENWEQFSKNTSFLAAPAPQQN